MRAQDVAFWRNCDADPERNGVALAGLRRREERLPWPIRQRRSRPLCELRRTSSGESGFVDCGYDMIAGLSRLQPLGWGRRGVDRRGQPNVEARLEAGAPCSQLLLGVGEERLKPSEKVARDGRPIRVSDHEQPQCAVDCGHIAKAGKRLHGLDVGAKPKLLET